ncbi:hypothetical protein SAMD00019534_084450 [Acytostelium subglobosum LB1]|uniref:hypothetical protein n=1 Tax=Acytostelium subglobosum LB1 TaxID=1410327 RepID=UPI000645143E|nr:hypothetical protein SAMD00019534_084450 [Acytostelium subglobosum LB1]GAM25270.1 hypothetical protein SAMD00019534_084450 [Acytostelium subglobosum LB1]|eukprot:XP_012751790.1 hypothetical protein SAMD00019534_084450 [Acytostelium subglobosum LB1]
METEFQQQHHQTQQQEQFQRQPTFITNHDPRDKLKKKRKNLDGKESGSSSPLNKLRAATLTRTATSKLQFVVDLGSSFSKSPSKSTANALSLHSSVPHHNAANTAPASPLTSSTNSIQFSVPNQPTKKSKLGLPTTLHRKSVRLSQQIKLDEVTKLYAPLSGPEYLSAKDSPLSPTLLRQQQKSKSSATQTSSSTSTTATATSASMSPPSTPQRDNNSGSNSTSLSPVLSSMGISSPRSSVSLKVAVDNGNNKENNSSAVNSPPTSPTMAPVEKSVAAVKQSSSSSSFRLFSRKSTSSSSHESELSAIKREVNDSCEFILAKMGEYQRIVLSLPDLFMLSNDILSTEYEYLIKDTKTISKILSPLDSVAGSDTNTEVICSPKPSSRYSTPLNQSQENQKLSEMDMIAQSISQIAKKILGIEIEMKKSSLTEKKACTLSLFVSAVRHYIETGEVPEIPRVPTEVQHTLIPSASETTTREYNPDSEADYVYKTGYLVKKGSKGPLVVWKDQWFVLSVEKLCIYSNEDKVNGKPKKEILLSNIVSIGPINKYEYNHCFVIKLKNTGSKLVVRAANDKDAALWMLAIDGLPRRNFDTNQSCINLYIKETLLETICSSLVNYRRSVAGGVVRSSHGEEWTYRADGTLYNSEPLDANIKAKDVRYVWNGQLLVPAKDCVKSLGSGKWNGVWLAWYHNNAPFLKYMWQQESNEYLNQNSNLSYKWSRGLVSKIGVGQWVIEGHVPETVVMFLQCLRYCRLGKDF